VIVAGDGYDESERLAIAAAARDRRTYVSAYEDDHVRAGNGGDLGRELLAQDPEIARVVVPVGGGGLVSGLAAELCPRGIEVIGAQPERNCAMAASLRAGRWLADYRGEPTLAEGCEGGVGPRCYEIASRWVGPIALVSEAAIRRAIAYLYREAGQIAEGAGAVGMAAVLEGIVAPASGTTVVVITGGNIEPSLLDEILAP
jgi:threonine dehydratase